MVFQPVDHRDEDVVLDGSVFLQVHLQQVELEKDFADLPVVALLRQVFHDDVLQVAEFLFDIGVVLLILDDGEILVGHVFENALHIGEHDFFLVAEMFGEFFLVGGEKAPDDLFVPFVAGGEHLVDLGGQVRHGDIHVIGMAAVQVGHDVPEIRRAQDFAGGHVAVEGVDLADQQERLGVDAVPAAGIFDRFVAETKVQADAGDHAEEVIVEVEQVG